jgi:hypothetical protein
MSLTATVLVSAAVSIVLDMGSAISGAHFYDKHLKGKKLQLPKRRKFAPIKVRGW